MVGILPLPHSAPYIVCCFYCTVLPENIWLIFLSVPFTKNDINVAKKENNSSRRFFFLFLPVARGGPTNSIAEKANRQAGGSTIQVQPEVWTNGLSSS